MTREPTTDDVNDNHNRTDANDNSVTTPIVRYSGAFTEKLFRSKSQPMLAFRRGLKVFNKEIQLCPSDEPSEDEEMLFADIGGLGGLAFSPVRGVKAPIIDFKDI